MGIVWVDFMGKTFDYILIAVMIMNSIAAGYEHNFSATLGWLAATFLKIRDIL